MEGKGTRGRFDGAAWFDRQVCKRTRAALTARGSKARTHSEEYKTEYAQQLALFRAERREVKRRKHEKYIARMKQQRSTDRIGA